MRRESDNANWGGRRSGAGRPKQYIKIPTKFHIERCEREQLTPESDLAICVAEMEEDGRRGIVIGEIWYGAGEALAIAQFIRENEQWLGMGEE